ncbi:MAG TPA: hypothetical protein QGH28_00755 [Chloroflexota bacterium]|nr:hypothetical protein [Chloroflexota bacterium]
MAGEPGDDEGGGGDAADRPDAGGVSGQWWVPWVTDALVVPVDALMQWGMLDGIRRRVEGS